ncbi:glutaminase A [Arthrobacter sulfonylureivorans]|uniref:glutaminase A n=1 Tax=Arthrobacter sulfonylureivorans TaxID=2486855 RepID=UPI0039E294F7
MSDNLESILAGLASNSAGTLAGEPEELGVADPDLLGLSMTMADGYTYEAGDTRSEFSIQSISKPFTYGMALAAHGYQRVREKIDVEPSGDAYNEISLEADTGRPRNALINAGALAAASLVAGHYGDDAFEQLRQMYSAAAGRDLTMNPTVYESARRTGDRNRAIAYLLKSQGVIEHDTEAALDLYFRQCSIGVTCRDLGVMAATLANRGTNPLTGEEVLAPGIAEHVLSVMTTCGMYNDAGDWVAGIGLPAKSGISGGILAALPGQLGLAVFSPRLDQHGNSVRGTEACRQLSEDLGLHFIHAARSARSTIRADYSLAERPSPRIRPAREQSVLAKHGHEARFLEVHGDMLFPEAETVIQLGSELAASHDVVVIDISRLDKISSRIRALFLRLQEASDPARLAFVDPGRLLAPVPGSPAGAANPNTSFPSVDAAAHWCEDHLIERYGVKHRASELQLSDHPVTDGMPTEVRAALADYLEGQTYDDGEPVTGVDGTSEGLFLVMAGQARVSPNAAGTNAAGTRASLYTAGTSFGRLGGSGDAPPRARVHAEGKTTVELLTPDNYVRLRQEHPLTALLLAERLVDIAAERHELAPAADEG